MDVSGPKARTSSMLRCPNLHFSFCLISFWPPASGHLKCNPLALRCSLSSLLTLLLGDFWKVPSSGGVSHIPSSAVFSPRPHLASDDYSLLFFYPGPAWQRPPRWASRGGGHSLSYMICPHNSSPPSSSPSCMTVPPSISLPQALSSPKD